MDKRTLNHLLNQVSYGNNEAFEILYSETKKGIYALLYPYFNNHMDTEDALEEVYMRIKDKVHLYQKHTDARAWIFQLAKNYALNVIRNRKIATEKYQEMSHEMPTVHKDNDQTLFILMQKVLTEEEYQIVIKHVLFYYKHKDIAKELGLPLGTVLSKYQKAIQKLREELNYE